MAKGRTIAIILDAVEKRELLSLTRKHGAPQALAERARIILAAASGLNNKEVAAKVGVCAAKRSWLAQSNSISSWPSGRKKHPQQR